MRFALATSVGGTGLPFCLGYAFQRGHIPSGHTVVGDTVALQASVKNRWPDGSVKFAVLSGRADLAVDTALVVHLSAATSSATSGPDLTLAQLKATGAVAIIDAGSFGRASWSDNAWETPFRSWVSGPQMSSWVYRKPIGSDPHLVAWLEVRLYAGGAVEVLPWLENGYLNVPKPMNKPAVYSFTLGPTRRFSASIDLPHHARTPLIAGTALSHWLAADPGVTPSHDVLYLQASELVPTYSAVTPASAPAVQQLVTGFQPLQKGNFDYQGDVMQATGYAPSIGLLPQHDVLYLTARSNLTYGAVVRNGYSAGRYGIHYRDESTNRPLRFSSYPTMTLTSGAGVSDAGASTTNTHPPQPAGTALPSWDGSHQPSVGYMAYLLTGRWYFMEEVQFAATLNYLNVTDLYRQGAKGLFVDYRLQTRNTAWSFRTLVQALTVTPDDDTELKAEFTNSVEANVAYFHAKYVAQPNNPYGIVQPGEDYSKGTAPLRAAPWQQDFGTGVWGMALAMDLPISAEAKDRMRAFFEWRARSVVGRLGPAGTFWYVNAAPYTMAISPSLSPDFVKGTGPWYASWAAMYAATYNPTVPWLGSTEGVLAAEILPGANAGLGNLQPAIAYAVRHGVAGAANAYRRMRSGSNWGALEAQFNTVPVWSVKPSSNWLPKWLAGKPLNEWVTIPGTVHAGSAAAPADNPADSYAFSNRRLAYSGMALKEAELILAACGGHGDYSGNEVTSIDIADDAPAWRLRREATPQALRVKDAPYYADGRPSSRHTYWSSHWNAQRRRVMLHGSRAVYGNGVSFGKSSGFGLDSQLWDAAEAWKDGQNALCQEEATGIAWALNGSKLYKWTPDTDTWTLRGDFGAAASFPPMCHDSKRDHLFALAWGDGQATGTGATAAVFSNDGTVRTPISFEPGAALAQFIAAKPSYAALEYDPDNDRYLFYAGDATRSADIYVITPTATRVWRISMLQLGAGSLTPPAVVGAGVLNRFRYVRQLKGFVLMSSGTQNIHFIRTA